MKRRLALGLSSAALVAAWFVGYQTFAAEGKFDLDQGWSDAQKNSWYSATQGSRLLPLAWLKALEQPGGEEAFLEDDYVGSFRYIPRSKGQLPLGFAIDDTDDESLSVTRLRWFSGQQSNEKWVGFNCAACHTAELAFAGTRIRVDGGPSLADFQGFIEALNQSLEQTLSQPDKFDRFANRVLGTRDTPLNRQSLKSALTQLVSWQAKIETMNNTDLRYGYGRLDAFGHIFNKIALVVDAANPTRNPSDAPVKYPVLWNVPQEDLVQWNGIAANKLLPTGPIGQPFDYGALARNVGEVIGVFADVKPTRNAGINGYVSSVQLSSLISMEQLLGSLRPPKWPKEFGPIDEVLAKDGARLYHEYCKDCHAVMESRTDLSSPITIKMTPLRTDALNRTDPWMACNAYLDTSETGVLEGTPRDYVKGPKLKSQEPLADVLTTTVEGVLIANKVEFLASLGRSFFGRQPPPHIVNIPSIDEYREIIPNSFLTEKERLLARCLTDDSPILGYKPRPLNGIWASAPYLHDGSVPTLYDLLTPPEDRPKIFWKGSRTFDPKKVGFVTERDADNNFPFRTRDLTDRIIDGNSNGGHDFHSGRLTPNERMALIEYLKQL